MITDQNFHEELDKCKTPVILDFYATWCGPCKSMTPIIEDIAKIYEYKLTVLKIDVDNCSELAQEYSVMSIPTLVFMDKNKVIVNQLSGYHSKEDILDILKTIYETTEN